MSLRLVPGEIVTIGPNLLFALVLAQENPDSETQPVVECKCEYTDADACQTYDMLCESMQSDSRMSGFVNVRR